MAINGFMKAGIKKPAFNIKNKRYFMVIYDKDRKNLVIPESLGNFGNAGGGEGITEEQARQIADEEITEALVDYVDEAQLTDTLADYATTAETASIIQSIEDLSGATGDISAISAQTDENTQAISAISQDIEDLSGATESVSSAVSANTDNITALSAQTSANTEAIEALSGVSGDIATLSAQTSANTANIEALSAATSALSITVETISGRTREKVLVDVYAVDNMSYADRVALWDEIYAKVLDGADVYATGEVQNTTQRAIVPLSQYVAETEPSTHIGGFLYFTSKAYGENLEIQFSFSSGGNLTGLSGSSKFNRVAGYTLPTATAGIKGGVKVGSGLTIDSEKLSVKIGDGLGFSGDTLVVSGGTGGGGDYMVVSELPESAEDGQLFFIPAHTKTVPHYVYIFNCQGMAENETTDFVVKDGDENRCLNGLPLYYEWDNGDYGWFHWNWCDNQNEWAHPCDGAEPEWGYFKVDQENRTFYAAVPVEQTFQELNEYVVLTTGMTAFTESVDAITYRYNEEKGGFVEVRDRLELNSKGSYDCISGSTEDLNKLCITYDSKPASFVEKNEGDGTYTFRSDIPIISSPIGAPLLYKSFDIGLAEGDVLSNVPGGFYPMPVKALVDMETSGLTTDQGDMFSRIASNKLDELWLCGNPIVVIAYSGSSIESYSTNTWFRPLWDTDNSDWHQLDSDETEHKKIFGCEFYYKGDKIVAEWVVSDWSSSVLNWTVTPAHSSSDSTEQ